MLNGARYEIATRHYPIYECTKCGYQTTLTAGTILEKTRTEVTLWFAAIYMAVQDGGASTASVGNELDISCQRAWAMMRKIRGALASPACVANAPKLSED